MEWLVVWGVANASGFIFKDVFLPLIQGALEDYTKTPEKSLTEIAPKRDRPIATQKIESQIIIKIPSKPFVLEGICPEEKPNICSTN